MYDLMDQYIDEQRVIEFNVVVDEDGLAPPVVRAAYSAAQATQVSVLQGWHRYGLALVPRDAARVLP
jgi:hypothetical protein